MYIHIFRYYLKNVVKTIYLKVASSQGKSFHKVFLEDNLSLLYLHLDKSHTDTNLVKLCFMLKAQIHLLYLNYFINTNAIYIVCI